jgi:hypothetical protein
MRLKWAVAVLSLSVSPAIVEAAPSGWDSSPVAPGNYDIPEPSARSLVGSPSTRPVPLITADLRDSQPVDRGRGAIVIPDPLHVTTQRLSAPSPGMQADPSSPAAGETVEQSMVRLAGDAKPLSEPPRAVDGGAQPYLVPLPAPIWSGLILMGGAVAAGAWHRMRRRA